MGVLASQLTKFTGSEKEWQKKHFEIKIDRTVWSVAGDDCVLMAVKATVPDPGKHKDTPYDIVKGWLEHNTPKTAESIPVSKLKAWAGPAPKNRIPKDIVDPQHQGVLLGKLVDRRKLAFILEKVNIPKVKVWYHPEANTFVFEPSKTQWRLFLAPLAGPVEGDELVFKHKEKAKSKPPVEDSVFDLAELADEGLATAEG